MSVFWSAEIGSNHNQDLSRTLKLIDTAKEIGCDGVKFQLFRIDKMFAPEVLRNSADHRAKKNWELPIEFLEPISERCKELNIQFGCSPGYLEAVGELEPYVDFYKIGSYELTWMELIRECARTGKPLMLGTGMAMVYEIGLAVNEAIQFGPRPLTLLHCVSAYPAKVSECNLSVIGEFRKLWPDLKVGWSDHTTFLDLVEYAVRKWKADVIELHLDLEDGMGNENDVGFFFSHCWKPDDVAELIDACDPKPWPAPDGNGLKAPQPSELAERDWRRDSDGLRPMKHLRGKFK